MNSYSIYVKRYSPTDPRLGRHVHHDERSLAYAAPEEDLSSLVSVRHQRYVPVFDQGQLGSCTGNAGTGCMGTAMFWTAGQKVLTASADEDEKYAVGLYSAATKIDNAQGNYPPTDTGSDGLSVAKVLKSRGLISGYTHALSLEAVLTALAKQPVIVGTEWDQDMFNPDPNGRLHVTGSAEGGHEYVLDELDVENQLVWMQNSWATSWGQEEGRAYYTWDDFSTLMGRDGDCTIFTPIDQPAPVPTPVPTPAPAPTQSFEDEARAWSSKKHTGANEVFSGQVKNWLTSQ